MQVRSSKRNFLPVERALVAAAFVFVSGAIFGNGQVMASAAGLALAAVLLGGTLTAMRGYRAAAAGASQPERSARRQARPGA